MQQKKPPSRQQTDSPMALSGLLESGLLKGEKLVSGHPALLEFVGFLLPALQKI
jgi:hypothetical protein